MSYICKIETAYADIISINHYLKFIQLNPLVTPNVQHERLIKHPSPSLIIKF